MSHPQDTDTRKTGTTFELLGHVAVDSARICVIDPRYADRVTAVERGIITGPVINEPGGIDLGFITGTAHGDGLYPVTLESFDGSPRRLIVELDDDDTEDEEQFTTIEELVSDAAWSAIGALMSALSAARRGGYDALTEKILTRLDLLDELTLPEPTDADALQANTDKDGI